MKNRSTLIVYTTIALLLTACGEEAKEGSSKTIKNPVGTYLDNRVDAMDMAKKSVKESNKRSEAQDKMMESLTK